MSLAGQSGPFGPVGHPGPVGPTGPSPQPGLYRLGWVPKKDGWVGSSHILAEGSKVAICGTKSRNWREHGMREEPLERIYRRQERKLKPSHWPKRSNSPCLRCMAAAQKLRDPLDRLSDIPLE